MSVTFMLPREFRAVTQADRQLVRSLPCPACDGRDRYLGTAVTQPDPDCRACHGFGGDRQAEDALAEREATEDGEFNVANGNAAYIVQDLLNLPCEEVYGGSIHPAMVLSRLGYVDTAAGVEQPNKSQAVHLTSEGVSLGCMIFSGGRSQRQCNSYVTRLRRLAEIAIERNSPSIVWG
jgi:hypothetical protein